LPEGFNELGRLRRRHVLYLDGGTVSSGHKLREVV
jgi:hypothetical protein